MLTMVLVTMTLLNGKRALGKTVTYWRVTEHPTQNQSDVRPTRTCEVAGRKAA